MSTTPSAEVSLRLFEAWEAGRAAWPRIALDQERFEQHLLARLPEGEGAAALPRIHHVDLYLAAACLHRVDGAVAAFDRAFLVHVPGFVRKIDASPAFGDEVRQVLRARLFVEEGGREARIAGYTGRGPVAAWLRVAAVRSALNLRRDAGGGAHQELDDAELAAGTGEDHDLELIKQRYREAFQQAVREAFAELPRDQRTVLRLHLSASLTTARIATMFQVNQSTVVRWMAAARASVRTGTLERLRARLSLTVEEFESLMALMLSRLDVSLASSISMAGGA